MQFALTNYGAQLFSSTGIPDSLTFVAGSGFNYAPSSYDTQIHGSAVANGVAPMVYINGDEPVYNVMLSSADFPGAVAFGEIGFYNAGVLVALGSDVALVNLQNKNVSLECILPTVAGALGFFSPIALSANGGNINVLSSIDVLPNANTATSLTKASGVSNSYIIAETGLLAVSTGVRWDLVGALFLTALYVDGSDFTDIYIKQQSPAALKFLSQLEVPCDLYVSVYSGVNTGLARTIQFTGLVQHAYPEGFVSSYKLETVAPWAQLFSVGDTVNVYVALPSFVKVAVGGTGPAGPAGLDSFVPGPAGPAGSSFMDGLFVLDVTPTNSGNIVANKMYPPTVPLNRVVTSCVTDNANVRVTVGLNGNSLSYSPSVTIAGVNATITESSTTRWFTAVADITVGAGITHVPVVSNTGAETSVDITLAGAGPNVLSISIGTYPNSQTTLKAGDKVTVTVTTEDGATEVKLLAYGASDNIVMYPVVGTTAVCSVTIGTADGTWLEGLAFSAHNSFGTYGNRYSTGSLIYLDQAYPKFGPLSVAYPASKGALTTGDSATVTCSVSDQTSVAYTAIGLTVDSPSVYAADKLVTLSSAGYVDSNTNYTINAFKSSNGSSSSISGLVDIATVAPTVAITTSPPGRMVGSPIGIHYAVIVTSPQNLSGAPQLTASAGSWAGVWTGSGKVWTRPLSISDSTPKGSALFSALGVTNLALIPGTVITSGANYVVGGFSNRTLTFPKFSRVTAIGTTVLDPTKTSCQIVAGNVLTLYSDNSIKSNGYYFANADGTYNPQGAYVALSDSVFAGSNTSGTLQVTLSETA